MPTVTYISIAGARHVVQARTGQSVMRAAIDNNVEGIEAECGGCLDCATCHVYVHPAFVALLTQPSDEEEALLQAVTAPRRPNSRLSCQIKLDDTLDGLVVDLPERQ